MKIPARRVPCPLYRIVSNFLETGIGRFPSPQWVLPAALLLIAPRVPAAGTWTALAHRTPTPAGSANGNVSLMLLLPDGTAMVENDATGNGGTNWFRLTPDIHGSYVNGTWSILAPMNDTRAGCASDVLTNGKVFFAGGEYGTGHSTAEVYDPVGNNWAEVPVPTNLINPTNLSPIWGGGTLQGISDAASVVIANGEVLLAPVAVQYAHQTMLYDPVANAFSKGPNLRSSSQAEASWVKLPDNSILTIDPATPGQPSTTATNTERFIPASTNWVVDANVPVLIYDGLGEMGPAFLLPNGHAFFMGGTGHTAIYTPVGFPTPGTWMAGPDIPMVGTNAQGCDDAPAAMMVNGKILLSTGLSGTYSGPVYFFEYDYVSNLFTLVNGPNNAVTSGIAPYYTKMLDLPDGTVLWNYGQPQMYSYQPDGTPLTNGKPVINTVTGNLDGSYHLAGTRLNGISQGAGYGDDAQMDSNFPLVRLTNTVSGNVYYARTYNWSSTGVQTGTRTLTTEFALPAGFPKGTYSLVAVANGIASDPVMFTFPLAPPVVTGFSLAGANLVLNGNNGEAGRTYRVLTSTDVTASLNSWTPVSTNVLGTNGAFTITATNAVNPGDPQRFYIIQAQ